MPMIKAIELDLAVAMTAPATRRACRCVAPSSSGQLPIQAAGGRFVPCRGGAAPVSACRRILLKSAGDPAQTLSMRCQSDRQQGAGAR